MNFDLERQMKYLCLESIILVNGVSSFSINFMLFILSFYFFLDYILWNVHEIQFIAEKPMNGEPWMICEIQLLNKNFFIMLLLKVIMFRQRTDFSLDMIIGSCVTKWRDLKGYDDKKYILNWSNVYTQWWI